MAGTSRSGAAAIALAILMAGAGCTTADEPAAPQLAGTSWRAETIMGRPVIDSSASTITFEADGRVHGRGGCNRYFGSSTIDGARLALGQLGSTRMACPEALMEQETRFFQALQGAERWTIDEHGLLLIYSTGTEEPSRFAPFEE
jgi:heat shock protein HslJ